MIQRSSDVIIQWSGDVIGDVVESGEAVWCLRGPHGGRGLEEEVGAEEALKSAKSSLCSVEETENEYFER